MKLIDKDALVSEIERRKNLCEKIVLDLRNQENKDYYQGKAEAYKETIDLLNTLEVKEVELDFTKEVDMWIKNNGDTSGFFNVQELAKHFFELGMRVSNPITASDRGTAEEIIINLKQVENDYRLDLTKEIEWVRNQVKKGE